MSIQMSIQKHFTNVVVRDPSKFESVEQHLVGVRFHAEHTLSAQTPNGFDQEQQNVFPKGIRTKIGFPSFPYARVVRVMLAEEESQRQYLTERFGRYSNVFHL